MGKIFMCSLAGLSCLVGFIANSFIGLYLTKKPSMRKTPLDHLYQDVLFANCTNISLLFMIYLVGTFQLTDSYNFMIILAFLSYCACLYLFVTSLLAAGGKYLYICHGHLLLEFSDHLIYYAAVGVKFLIIILAIGADLIGPLREETVGFKFMAFKLDYER